MTAFLMPVSQKYIFFDFFIISGPRKEGIAFKFGDFRRCRALAVFYVLRGAHFLTVRVDKHYRKSLQAESRVYRGILSYVFETCVETRKDIAFFRGYSRLDGVAAVFYRLRGNDFPVAYYGNGVIVYLKHCV